jgi:hypothetical protein
MQALSLGLIRVPTPGTPVRITTDESIRAMMIVIRTVPGFTGKTYLGVQGMNKNSSNLPGVVRVLSEPPAYGPQDGEVLPPTSSGQGNVLRPSDYWVDADIANEGVLISYYIA